MGKKRKSIFLIILVLIIAVSITAIVYAASEILFKDHITRGTFVINNITAEEDIYGHLY